MGKRDRLRREAFFARHPTCCFCGGGAPAVEFDHIPARHLFRGRHWPVGYEFPACEVCNDASTGDELVMGFLVRMATDERTPDDAREFEAALRSVIDRYPHLVKGIRELSRIETRKLLRVRGLTISSIPWELYAVAMPKELIDVPQRYGDKLGRALYYLHTGRIVPPGGGVTVKVMTNVDFMSPQFPRERFNILNGRPALTRSGKSLEDQFVYRYAVPIDGHGAGFLVQFGRSMAMVILVYEDESAYQQRVAARRAYESTANSVPVTE